MAIEKYKKFLEKYRRYESFRIAKEELDKINGERILELGTTRSFVDGSHEGCMVDDEKYWFPNNPEMWDWGAGAFTLVFAESYFNTNTKIITLDICQSHINRCKIMTERFKNVDYVISCSIEYLKSQCKNSFDLIYMDTGDCDERGAKHQEKETEIIIGNDLLKSKGLILIDDHNKLDKNLVNKTKYSLPLYLNNNYKIIYEGGEQILLKKND